MMEKMPYELLNGRKPNIAYFWVFGCKCYILKKGNRLGRFEKKCDEGFLLGYLTTSKALLVFLNAYINNPQAHGITVVAFHPEVFRVSYFHEEWMCKSLLARSPKVTRRKIARVVRFSRDRDPKPR